MNFNVVHLENGIKRRVNNLYSLASLCVPPHPSAVRSLCGELSEAGNSRRGSADGGLPVGWRVTLAEIDGRHTLPALPRFAALTRSSSCRHTAPPVVTVFVVILLTFYLSGTDRNDRR